MSRTYRQDQEKPDYPFTWRQHDGTLYDLSTGWTFQIELVSQSTGSIVATITTGIAGAATAPNVTVGWATGQFAGLTPGVYEIHLRATSGTDDMFFRPGNWPLLEVVATPT